MKVLIVGVNSYIGKKVGEWLENKGDEYQVEYISVRDELWKTGDYSTYDVVFYVAAIVHGKNSNHLKELSYRINKDYPIMMAEICNKYNVPHFIYMSTFSVYGIEGHIGGNTEININTPCSPTSIYGKSKHEAEKELLKLDSNKLKIAIIRVPMVYGPNCPGNYMKLRRIAKKIRIFPEVNNKRSMIFIDNLSEFIRLIIENHSSGILIAQNNEYVNTSNLVSLIGENNRNKIRTSKSLGFIFSKLGKNNALINKIFGNFVADLELTNHFNYKYCVSDFYDSVKRSEESIMDLEN